MTAHVTGSILFWQLLWRVAYQLCWRPRAAFFSNLTPASHHYGTGSAPIYFGAGYVGQGTWWKLRFLISLVTWSSAGIGPFCGSCRVMVIECDPNWSGASRAEAVAVDTVLLDFVSRIRSDRVEQCPPLRFRESS